MPKVRNILPTKERKAGAGRALRPFTHGMDEFFDEYFPRRWMEGLMEPYFGKRPFLTETEELFDVIPKVDILDRGDTLVVRAEMPGVKREDLDITIAGDRLMIEAKRELDEEEKTDEFFRHEMAYGRLYRTVHLPVEVVGDEAKAELKEGVLEMILPKVEATTPFKVKVA